MFIRRLMISVAFYILCVLERCHLVRTRVVRRFAFHYGCTEAYLIHSGAFDAKFYAKECAESFSAREGLRHYLNIGWKMGLNPSARFSTVGYLHCNEDVRKAGINPLVHYLEYGLDEGRITDPQFSELHQMIADSDLFDSEWYSEKYSIDGGALNAIEHYCSEGWRKGYSPSAAFSGERYMQAYPEVKDNPLVHWLRYGRNEFNRISFIDGEMYATMTYLTGCLSNDCGRDKRILLVSNPLKHTGAPIALLNLGRLLKEKGYHVFILAADGGDLEADIKESGISIIIDPTILLPNEETRLPFKFEFCVCNTALMWAAYQKFSKIIPTIWWVHENFCLGDGNLPSVAENVLRNTKHLCVIPSERTLSCLNTFNHHITPLPYPVLDLAHELRYYSKGKIRFAIIGTITPGKGQDVFTEAVAMLPDSVREKASFELIGYAPKDDFASRVLAGIKGIREMKYRAPILNSGKYHSYMDTLDVICCVSREDALPIVVTEGLMHGRIPIISETVGHAGAITNGVNGYVIRTGDSKRLAEIMRTIIENPQDIAEMQGKARKLFMSSYFNYYELSQQIDSVMESVCHDFEKTENRNDK